MSIRAWQAPGLLPIVLLMAALVPAACGVGKGSNMDHTDTNSGGAPSSSLVITVDDGSGAPTRSWTLTCDPPGGDHPDAASACRVLAQARTPFAPVPQGMACTQIYGGPETATIEGTWQGEPVRASYRRTDGCEINRWKAVAVVLGA